MWLTLKLADHGLAEHGADVATMATCLATLTAVYVRTRTQRCVWQQQKAATSLRTWHGCIGRLSQASTFRLRRTC